MIEVTWRLFVPASTVTPGQDMIALSGRLRARPEVLGGIYRTPGAVLVGLGLKLAFERRG